MISHGSYNAWHFIHQSITFGTNAIERSIQIKQNFHENGILLLLAIFCCSFVLMNSVPRLCKVQWLSFWLKVQKHIWNLIIDIRLIIEHH